MRMPFHGTSRAAQNQHNWSPSGTQSRASLSRAQLTHNRRNIAQSSVWDAASITYDAIDFEESFADTRFRGSGCVGRL